MKCVQTASSHTRSPLSLSLLLCLSVVFHRHTRCWPAVGTLTQASDEVLTTCKQPGGDRGWAGRYIYCGMFVQRSFFSSIHSDPNTFDLNPFDKLYVQNDVYMCMCVSTTSLLVWTFMSTSKFSVIYSLYISIYLVGTSSTILVVSFASISLLSLYCIYIYTFISVSFCLNISNLYLCLYFSILSIFIELFTNLHCTHLHFLLFVLSSCILLH